MSEATITCRMNEVFDGLGSNFQCIYDKNDFLRKMNALEAVQSKSVRPSILAGLYEMFDNCKIPYEKGRDNAYYRDLVENADIPSYQEMEDKMMLALFSIYEEYPTPEAYMLRMVNRLSKEEDVAWQSDTLRVRILKQFIKYGNYLSGAKYGGKKYINDYIGNKFKKNPKKEEVISYVDDGVFDILLTAEKEDKKPKGKYGLLKLVDDLAGGKFRTGGATKKGLYLFAMVYDMTYYSGEEDEVKHYETDIEKNLFRDYYSNNLMRFITDDYKGKLSDYELDPSGQGINYKNFAEMVYLYYLTKDYLPEEKIRRATKMINEIKKESNQTNDSRNRNTDDSQEESTARKKDTRYYKGMFYRREDSLDVCGENLFEKSEEAFQNFIIENYDCCTVIPAAGRNKERTVGEIQVETEQETAYRVYQDLRSEMEREGIQLENCNYGLSFTDVSTFNKKRYGSLCDRHPEIDCEKFRRFMELLLAVNHFLGCTVDEQESAKTMAQEWEKTSVLKTKALYLSSAAEVTRTSIIVAYYYYYNAIHEGENEDDMKNFAEMFQDFKYELDKLLKEAFYQPFSGKNIFDVIVAFSAYHYINL